jgi:DNA mismatch repair protein MutS
MIRRRLDAVQAFLNHAGVRRTFRSAQAGIGDLERLGVRASFGEATPRELGLLRDGLLESARAVVELQTVNEPDFRETLEIVDAPDVLSELAEELDRALVERPPNQLKEGGMFRTEFDAELAEFSKLKDNGTEAIVSLETRLRQETDIGNLKVRYTRVFGWYIEVSKSQVGRVPKKWHRKQTIAGGERYTVDELDELAERIQNAEVQFRARELELLEELTEKVRRSSDRIFALGARVAQWDVFATLAEVAHEYDYCRPEVDADATIHIVEGRHPVVERLAAAGTFVPNDVLLDHDGERMWLITGPNMAGKSTLLRQTALTAILAQMGSYVPAKQARIGLVDRVLSRVGASDNLARGESTFMVEMKETAEILRSATKRSLVIVDEIGRGTSTFDGLSIAWAVAEYLADVVECRTLFATHYHELTELAAERGSVTNHSVSARQLDDSIVFLHRLVSGAASRSYGVAVAKLAGLPEAVLARAQAILNSLEGGAEAPLESKRRRRATPQLGLFDEGTLGPQSNKEQREVMDTLVALDPERLTPIEALNLLVQLKKRLSRR